MAVDKNGNVQALITLEVKNIIERWAEEWDRKAIEPNSEDCEEYANFLRCLTYISMQRATIINAEALIGLRKISYLQVETLLKEESRNILSQSAKKQASYLAKIQDIQLVNDWLDQHLVFDEEAA